VAQRCHVCGKGTLSGNSVSHANNATKRKWNPNLQRVRAMIAGQVKNVRVCTKCLKANKVQKAARGRHRVAAA
jgi:large subunit ribosomal protein L28